ncbi:putative disease resistance protein, partial [Trifolium pratense]
MDVLIKVNEILEFIMTMRKENLVGAQIWGLSGNQIWGLWGAPEEPVCVVGMNEPLNNLKIELIKDGVSVHVLTGFGGSGKSTLAKKLCWDSQIK